MATLSGAFSSIYDRKFSTDASNYYTGIVHPLTFKSLQHAVNKLRGETNMGGMDCENKPCEEETPLQREMNERKYRVRTLRAAIARNQEELRIQNALLATVKKLTKGGK